MRRLRTASTRRLLLIVAVLVAAVTGAGIAQAALTTEEQPAPKPLDRALFDAANAKPVEGVTARIKFTNNLLPSGSLPEGTASPALTGASGRLWLSNDGKLRLELQSANGDAQIVADGERYLIYDAASKQAFTGKLQSREQQPKRKGDPTKGHQIFSSVCVACHRLKGEGVDVAPDITDVKIKEKEALLSDILDPNRMVEARWMAYQIDLKDGRIAVGIISAETSSEVTVKMAGGITEAIPRANITKMKSLDASLMPVGLEAGITKEQMADLLAYLKGE